MSDASQTGSDRQRILPEKLNDIPAATADASLVNVAAESAERPIRVNLPPGPPELTPGAARVLIELREQERERRAAE